MSGLALPFTTCNADLCLRLSTIRRPTRVAIMQEENAVGIVVPACPHIGRRYGRHRSQEVRCYTPVALIHIPLHAVPVQYQWHSAACLERFEITHRPPVVRRYRVQVAQVD